MADPHCEPPSWKGIGAAVSTPKSERRMQSDRRAPGERRHLIAAESGQRPCVAPSRTAGDRRLNDAFAATVEPIRKLTAAVEALTARVSDMNEPRTEKPTCTVEEAASLLGTTTRGIYALHERGKLPPTVGPGRRLLWRRDDLLQCRRRASSPEKDRR